MPWSLIWQAICLVKLGRLDEARACVAKYFEMPGHVPVDQQIESEAFRNRSVNAWLKATLRETGLVDAQGETALSGPAGG